MLERFSRGQICPSSVRLLLVTKLNRFHAWTGVRGANGEIIVKDSLKATALAFGLAMLCSSVTWGCGEAINSAVHNEANFARQNEDNQNATATPTTAQPAAAFFTVRNYKVVATSAAAPPQNGIPSSLALYDQYLQPAD